MNWGQNVALIFAPNRQHVRLAPVAGYHASNGGSDGIDRGRPRVGGEAARERVQSRRDDDASG